MTIEVNEDDLLFQQLLIDSVSKKACVTKMYENANKVQCEHTLESVFASFSRDIQEKYYALWNKEFADFTNIDDLPPDLEAEHAADTAWAKRDAEAKKAPEEQKSPDQTPYTVDYSQVDKRFEL